MKEPTEAPEAPYEWTVSNRVCLVEAMLSAHRLIEKMMSGKPALNDMENYFMNMRAAMGAEWEGVLIEAFLQDLSSDLYEAKAILVAGNPKTRQKKPKR